MTNGFYIALAALGGALLPLQALINARLGTFMGGSLWAATISFAVGTIGLACFLVIGRQDFPSLANVPSLPIWIWIGGLLGAVYVSATIITVKPLGAATMVSLVIFGKIIAALLLDHFGVLQNPTPITPIKILGAVFLMLGVFLILNK